jgi:formylglycine-generating enzyme required for sulfatase activity
MKGKSTLDNPETLVTHWTQDEEKQNKEGAINTGQFRDTGNTLDTRRGKTKQRRGNQHWTIQRHW